MSSGQQFVLAISGWMASVAVVTGAVAPLAATFSAEGLARVEVAGVNVLQNGRPQWREVVLEESLVKDGDRQFVFTRAATQPLSAEFDGRMKRLTQRFAWGTATMVYEARPDRLTLTLTLSNATKQTIANFDVQLLTLRLPELPAALSKKRSAVASTLDTLVWVPVTVGERQLLVACETVYPPLHFGLEKGGGADEVEVAVRAHGGVYVAEPGAFRIWPHGLPRVAAGGTLTLRFSLRVGAADAAPEELAGDIVTAFRQHWQPALDWPDRRPIGSVFVASVAAQHKSATNPRGWFSDPKIDVTTPEGRAAFRQRALKFADNCVRVLTNLNAQGAIIWNLEGEEHPHPITYLGDPTRLAEFAPEMDEVADEFFARFRAAGLRTGVTIRPTHPYYDDGRGQFPAGWRHGTGSDCMPGRGCVFGHLKPDDLAAWKFFPIAERLIHKIAYAKKRWGCTIFYLDTNGVHRPVGEDQKFLWMLLNADIYRQVRAAHPDVLIIPEFYRYERGALIATCAFVAPYMELRGGWTGTREEVWRWVPEAFSVVNVSDGDFAGKREALRRAVARGDILLFHGWWWPKRNEEVRALYEEVYPGFLSAGPRAAWHARR